MKRVFYTLSVAAALLSSFSSCTAKELDNHDSSNDGSSKFLRASSQLLVTKAAEATQNEHQNDNDDDGLSILRDYEYTKSLRDNQASTALLLLQQSRSKQSSSSSLLLPPRQLIDTTCLPNKSKCSSTSPSCCQGGCTSKNQCYCQLDGHVCFNEGKEDIFCCSNKCGLNGRCVGAIADDDLEDGGDDEVIEEEGGGNTTTVETGTSDTLPLHQNTFPLYPSTETDNNNGKGGNGGSTKTTTTNQNQNCKSNGHVCFNDGQTDTSCCSNHCGSIGRCTDVSSGNNNSDSTTSTTPVPTKFPTKMPTTPSSSSSNNNCNVNEHVCFNTGRVDTSCCSNFCGTNGRCSSSSNSFATPTPTKRPTKKPTPQPISSSSKVDPCSGDGHVCFNNGRFDTSCCSNQCGSNGRCTSSSSSPTPPAQPVTKRPSTKPTRLPTKKPTLQPILQPSGGGGSAGVSSSTTLNCHFGGHVCFNTGKFDASCCSQQCGSNGRCTSSPGATRSPTKRPTKKPTRQPILQLPLPSGVISGRTDPSTPTFTTNGGIPSGGSNGYCNDASESKVTIEIQTDQWGADVSWSLVQQSNERVMYNINNGTYGLYHYDKVDLCVPSPSLYNFTITDRYGDGICCAYGDGYVKVYINNREILHVQSYGKGMSELLNVGYDPTSVMSERDHLYLEAHNRRRTQWYAEHNVEDVSLVWSPVLAEESRIWAKKLLVNCSIADIEHEAGVAEGENLAKNTGTVNSDGGGWGQLYPPDNIVGRWVEFEIKRDYPGNAHLTQALWRGAKYMGCGESEQVFLNGMCRVQVCRYARAGNCDMGRYNSTIGKNWLPPMLADTSRCGPNCPRHRVGGVHTACY